MSALCYASYSGGFQKIFLSSGEGQLLDVFSTGRLVATETGNLVIGLIAISWTLDSSFSCSGGTRRQLLQRTLFRRGDSGLSGQ